MANIITYQTVTPASTDLVLGNYMNASGISETKTFTVASIAASGSVTSLTTSGTSGVATLSSGVLNIPNYTEEVPHQQKLVTLSAAQIISLNGASSLELIPAPGAGKIIVVSEILFFLDYGGVAFNITTVSGYVRLTYGSSVAWVGSSNYISILNKTADYYLTSNEYLEPEANQALNFHSSSIAVTAGDSLVKFNIVYRILDATTLA